MNDRREGNPGPDNTPELSLILPVLNEATFIERVAEELVHALEISQIDYQLVLVENGSTDGTLAVLRRLAEANPRVRVGVAPRRGWGSAILTGYRLATGAYVAHMPSDGQVDPRVVWTLLTMIKDNVADMVKVRRMTRESWLRSLVSRTYNTLANLFFNTGLADINGCPKLYPASLIRTIPLTSQDSFLDFELVIGARRLGLRVREFPIRELPRVAGKSNTNLLTVLEFLKNMVAFRLRHSAAGP
jgi:glycosyltransferase involved in cell wall biosynthesis